MEPTDPHMSNPAVPSVAAVMTPTTFAYQAQTADGQRLTGTIEALNAEEAAQRLEAMRLRVVEIGPAQRPPRSGRPLRGDDFAAFNQQLAQLAAAGMPVEHGLRLIAADLRKGRLARTVEQLAAELERGTPLDQAFDKFQGQFPPLYGRLVAAGVTSGNLSGVLLNLGRHLDTVERLRNVLWRTLAYPMFVVLALGFLLTFLGMVVLPQFQHVYADFHIQLPVVTDALLEAGRFAPALLVLLLIVIVGAPILWATARALGFGEAIVERVALPLPLVGPVLKNNLLARWCDAVKIGVDAGLDLPAAMALAGDATRSRRLIKDGQALAAALASGMPLTAVEPLLLPRTIPSALQFGSAYHDLGTMLASLSDLYQRQAELRLASLPQVLTPILVLLIALFVGFVIFALLAPLVALLESLTK
jgi:type II secretory pathway component PulF